MIVGGVEVFDEPPRRSGQRLIPGSPCGGCGDDPLPSPLRQAANAVGAVARHVADGLRAAPPELLAMRLDECAACPRLRPHDRKCSACGCYVDLKASWRSEVCPDGHW
jgi:hypothetical protein